MTDKDGFDPNSGEYYLPLENRHENEQERLRREKREREKQEADRRSALPENKALQRNLINRIMGKGKGKK